MASNDSHITELLLRARGAEQGVADDLFPLVYDELRSIAHQRLAQHRPGQTLNTTALVHEAYIKLVDQNEVEWEDRAHFFALSSRAMRFIIIDYARARTAQKRGGNKETVPLHEVQVAADEAATDLLTLDQALDALGEVSERLGQLVEYRFFGGMTYDEISAVTGRSVATVKRDWKRARTWLYQAMKERDDDGDAP